MASVDAYSPCPCGSGQKFKWCCQKAESYVDRAQRLERNGQYEAALAVLNEAIGKLPDLALPRFRKVALLSALGRTVEARECMEELLKKHSDHPGARALNFRLLLESGDVDAAVAEVQSTLSSSEGEPGFGPASIAAITGLALARIGRIPSGLAHLELAQKLSVEPDEWVDNSLDSVRANPATSAWVKNPYKPAPTPEAADAEIRGRFDEALDWMNKGLWERAAAAFELLSADKDAGLAAERNLGLCRLWLGDEPAAIAAFRRVVSASPVSTDIVDLEALCQLIDPAVGDDPVEEVELTWPLRDRAGLLTLLRDDRRFVESPDLGDDEAPGNEAFFLQLDRPRGDDDAKSPDPSELPLILADVVVGPDSVMIATRDDGRLNAVIDGFTAVAGQTIPPAHPRTKVVGSTSRGALVFQIAPFYPPALSDLERRRLSSETLTRQVETRWPETPMVFLGGKTPLEAAKSGGFEVPLRAALTLLEEDGQDWTIEPDWAALRDRLGVPDEPALDPIDVDIDATHLGRLHRIDPKGLQDDRLIQLYEKGHDWGLTEVVGAAALEIAGRRRLLEREGPLSFDVVNDLAMRDASRGDREAAMAWIARGREVTPAARRAETAPMWDMLGIQVGMVAGSPEEWVPELVAIMERYESNEAATRLVMSRLVRVGLLRLHSDPDRPGEMSVDPTPLHNLIARYGPRVQGLGGGSAGGGIWTPGSEAGGGGIWTPGSSSAPAAGGEKPRLILPGQ